MPSTTTTRDAFNGTLPFSLRSDVETPLRAHIAKSTPVPSCTRCLTGQRRNKNNNDLVPGSVAHLGGKHRVSRDSVIHAQAHVNEGAYEHPGIVLLESTCSGRCQVFIAPVTSFDGRGILAKFDRAGQEHRNSNFWEYLSLDQDAIFPPHNNLPMLELASGNFTKVSYAHLRCGYWIEKANLQPFKNGHGKAALTSDALAYARWAYGVCESYYAGTANNVKENLPTPSAVAWRPRQRPALGDIPLNSAANQGTWRQRPTPAAAPVSCPPRTNTSTAPAWRSAQASNTRVPYSVGKDRGSWRSGS